MNKILTYFLLMISVHGYAQNAGLKVHIQMDRRGNPYINYTIRMKVCDIKATALENITDSTSFSCSAYRETMDTVSRTEEEKYKRAFNRYNYYSDEYADGKLLVFKVTNESSRAWYREMYIVVPLNYASSVITLRIDSLRFETGKLLVLKDFDALYKKNGLLLQHTIRNEILLEADKVKWMEILR